MKKARFCMIFFGMGCTHTDGRNHNIDAAISLTRDLNTHTKCSIMAMRGHYNIAGPGQVWAWQFGFPYCIDLSKGTHAHMNPGETSSVDLAMRDEVDCFVNVGTDAGAHFPIQAVQHLKKHPFITIDPNFNMASEISDLHIPVRIAGVDEPGVVYRMDNVPIQFRSVIKGLPGVPSDEELFNKVYERMCELTKTEPIWLAAKEDRKISRIRGGDLKMASGEMIIKGGFIIDPTRKIDGDVRRCCHQGWQNCRQGQLLCKGHRCKGQDRHGRRGGCPLPRCRSQGQCRAAAAS